jgi:hypothetical protein
MKQREDSIERIWKEATTLRKRAKAIREFVHQCHLEFIMSGLIAVGQCENRGWDFQEVLACGKVYHDIDSWVEEDW